MQNDIVKNNQVTLTGKIIEECKLSHELFGEKFYEFKIEVPRLSELTDNLLITMSERLINKDLLTIGTMVNIDGQFRSYNNKNNVNNKLKLTIFARDILIESNPEQMINNVLLNGFICKKPVYRTTPLGREICDIIIAVNRSYQKSDYIPIITWGRNARFSKNLVVGDHVKIWGRIQSRTYEKKLDTGEIQKRLAYEVSVSKMELNGNNKKDTKNEE